MAKVSAGVTRKTRTRHLGGGVAVRRVSTELHGQSALDLIGGGRNALFGRDDTRRNLSEERVRPNKVEIQWSHIPEERAAALELYRVKYEGV